MLDSRIEIPIFILLAMLLTMVITPLMNIIFYDVLPTNSNISVKEFIKSTVPKDSSYAYIQKEDYIFVDIYDDDKHLHSRDYAYKGKTSGFISISFGWIVGNKSRARIEVDIIDGVDITYYLVKHKDNYLLTISSFDTSLILNDNEGDKIDNIIQGKSIVYFEVLNSVPEKYAIYGSVNDKSFLVIDYQMIKDIIG